MRWGLGMGAVAVVCAAAAVGVEGQGIRDIHVVDREHTSSFTCLACHDGTVGEGVQFAMRPDDLGLSHPVEVNYEAAAARHPGEYVPSSQLPRGVPLVNGNVACTSCHDGLSTEPHFVWHYDKLCTSCHIK